VAEGQLSLGWSPDGQQIATTGLAQDRLTLVNLRDSSEVTIALECDTTCSFGGAPPVYSPDGDRIALSGESGFWIVTLPDGHAVRITEETDRPLTWTEDWIYFTREEPAASGKRYPVIYRIAPDGGSPQLYARLPEDCHTWELALSQDASMAVCAVFDERPDVHIVENFDAQAR
jgi:Tol biopolymer transport system component